MRTERHVDAHIDKHILPLHGERRLADGSIDYRFYDRRTRALRAGALQIAGRAIVEALRRPFGIARRTYRAIGATAATGRRGIAPAE
jgi:hypothetical protein